MARTYLVLTYKERRLVQPQMGVSPPRRVAEGVAELELMSRPREGREVLMLLTQGTGVTHPLAWEPAFLPPRPQQVEGRRGRRSPAAPTTGSVPSSTRRRRHSRAPHSLPRHTTTRPPAEPVAGLPHLSASLCEPYTPSTLLQDSILLRPSGPTDPSQRSPSPSPVSPLW